MGVSTKSGYHRRAIKQSMQASHCLDYVHDSPMSGYDITQVAQIRCSMNRVSNNKAKRGLTLSVGDNLGGLSRPPGYVMTNTALSYLQLLIIHDRGTSGPL